MMRLFASRLAASRFVRRWLATSVDTLDRERLRIACELHDVVAHDLSVLTLGVGAGRMIMDRDPDRARQTLREAEESGRRVLRDLQRLHGLLRVDGMPTGPQPRLTDLPGLLDRFHAVGLPTTLEQTGDPAAGLVLELSVYRIIEEALRGALLQGEATTAAVTLDWQRTILDLTISDNGTPRGRLTGVWERAALFGGSVTTRATDTGRELRVRLLLNRGDPVS